MHFNIYIYIYTSFCFLHAGPVQRTTKTAMEAKLTCRACKKGILFPTSTTIYQCYNCQRAIPSHPIGGARITCSGCGGEFIVPTNITAYRCSFCDTLTNPISSHAQPTQDTQTHSLRKKFGSILFKHDQSQRVIKRPNFVYEIVF